MNLYAIKSISFPTRYAILPSILPTRISHFSIQSSMKHISLLTIALLIFSGGIIAQSNNDYCNNRQGISEGYTYFDNSQATVSQGWPADCWEIGEEASLWFQFVTPPYPSSVVLELGSDTLPGPSDTQIGITSEGCGTDYLYCDDNSGPGNHAGLYFDCGELQENTAYIFVVNSSFASTGVAYINLQFDGSCGDSLIYGCMDPVALNYNPFVNVDDGSCYYIEDSLALFGCTDPVALNYNPVAIYDDGSCYYEGDSVFVYGCTDVLALNYNPQANVDDGSCYYEGDSVFVYGCTDMLALNYNPQANVDDGSCIYDTDTLDVYGCTDILALNYNPVATIDDGSCTYQTDTTIYFGCADSYATNYNPQVLYDDGSCIYNDSLGGGYGCTDSYALNYDPEATNNDFSCEYPFCNASFSITGIDQENNVVYVENNSTATGELEFIWDFGDGTISTEAYPTHVYDENGNYMICLTVYETEFGCADSICDTLSFYGFLPGGGGEAGFLNGFTVNVIAPQANGLDEDTFLSEVSLFPNPSAGHVQLALLSIKSQVLDLSITDAMGREVWTEQVNANEGELRIDMDLESLQDGLYLISIQSKDAILTRSILIAR